MNEGLRGRVGCRQYAVFVPPDLPYTDDRLADTSPDRLRSYSQLGTVRAANGVMCDAVPRARERQAARQAQYASCNLLGRLAPTSDAHSRSRVPCGSVPALCGSGRSGAYVTTWLTLLTTTRQPGTIFPSSTIKMAIAFEHRAIDGARRRITSLRVNVTQARRLFQTRHTITHTRSQASHYVPITRPTATVGSSQLKPDAWCLDRCPNQPVTHAAPMQRCLRGEPWQCHSFSPLVLPLGRLRPCCARGGYDPHQASDNSVSRTFSPSARTRISTHPDWIEPTHPGR